MRRRRLEKGTTLIETLVATAVLLAGASSMLNMLTLSALTTRANALDTHAVALAVQEREDMRSLVYSAIATRDPYPTGSPDLFNGVGFTVHTDVQTDQPAASMKTVSVTVSWRCRGQPRSYALQTVYTNING